MIRLELLPAACGDCLWLEYGEPSASRIVIIDGGIQSTASVLRQRMSSALRARNADTLDIELLVVTHIDNDHIKGITELLREPDPRVNIKEIWFNGRTQLNGLPPLTKPARVITARTRVSSLGWTESSDEDDAQPSNAFPIPESEALLGPKQGDELSQLLEQRSIPWNRRTPDGSGIVMVADDGALPTVALDGGLKLTLLGPSLMRLHKLRALWTAALLGDEDRTAAIDESAFLRRADVWPPCWQETEVPDSSVTNGSSILLLAELDEHALLLGGDAHADDIETAIARLQAERNLARPFPLAAFKLPHHGSEKNVTRDLLERIDCSRYLVSTDGSWHRHPDHQALLRILRFAKRPVQLLFNHAAATTTPWRDSKADVLESGIGDYEALYPNDKELGMILELH